jgi:hypothetical protein
MRFGVIAFLGFSLWFFLVFPWADHNESYVWRVQFDRMGPLEVLTQRLYQVETYRPLGDFTAWLSYRSSGGSVYPQQFLNYVLAAAAWFLLFLALREKRLFSCIAFAVGSLFFSGYVFLFHLHGVFYSPVLMYIAVLFALYARALTTRRLIALSTLTLVIYLYHPFVLLLFGAFIIGLLLERRHIIPRRQFTLSAMFLLMTLGLIVLAGPGGRALSVADRFVGLLTSYATIEVHPLLALASVALAFITVLSLPFSLRTRMVGFLLCGLAAFACYLAGRPVILLWIAACLVKALLLRKWALVALISVATLFPAAAATGSPTYAIFVIMICTAVAPMGWTALENRLTFVNGKSALALAVVVIAIITGLRIGLPVPFVSGLVNPLLAEKEKTFQLKDVITWMKDSPFRDYRLVLYQTATNPAIANNAIDRRYRPPTTQDYLDEYIAALRPGSPIRTRSPLLVCFGGEPVKNAQAVCTVAGRYNGEAIVYVPAVH